MYKRLHILNKRMSNHVFKGILINMTTNWQIKIIGYVLNPNAKPFISVPNKTMTRISTKKQEKEIETIDMGMSSFL